MPNSVYLVILAAAVLYYAFTRSRDPLFIGSPWFLVAWPAITVLFILYDIASEDASFMPDHASMLFAWAMLIIGTSAATLAFAWLLRLTQLGIRAQMLMSWSKKNRTYSISYDRAWYLVSQYSLRAAKSCLKMQIYHP
ncbi:hypothetical protein MED16_gp60 [Pantoea phage vB_PagS_MED16]|nr:hypothetical protein MED16_gp60 [Pantoea phage vB_PagS_MED16]